MKAIVGFKKISTFASAIKKIVIVNQESNKKSL